MTSKQSKNDRVKESELIRAKEYEGMDTTNVYIDPPPGSVLADPSELEHNNTYSPFPRFYVDKIIVCRNCKKEEVWSANNQKWWYEEAKGNINTKAVLCRACRDKEKARKDAARKVHLDGIAKKNET